MDAVKFLIEKRRMCNVMSSCDECPLNENAKEYSCEYFDDIEEAVDIVETWSKENPIITNGDKFKEVFGISSQELLAMYHHELFKWFKEEYNNDN